MDSPRSSSRPIAITRARYLVPAAAGIAIMLAACLADPADPKGGAADGGDCTTGQRLFNGACRTVCTTSAQCSAPDTCMTVAPDVAVCVDYGSCSYLGDDTECGGVPFNSYGYPEYDPYAYDPYGYNPYDSYGGYGGYGGATPPPVGCGGNATYVVAPPAAGDDPRCGQEHTVRRCQKSGNTCTIVTGTTIDIAEK